MNRWMRPFAVLLAAATAFVAGLRATAMVRAMLATACFQLLITALAAYGGWGASEPPGANGIFGLNMAFSLLWLISAGLFWKSRSANGR